MVFKGEDPCQNCAYQLEKHCVKAIAEDCLKTIEELEGKAKDNERH